MDQNNAYEKIAQNLSQLGMPIASTEEMVEILKANLSSAEAEVVATLPTKVIPLDFRSVDELTPVPGLSQREMMEILEGVARKGIVLSGKTSKGITGYALWQSGFGFTQVFYWKGAEDSPHLQNMCELIKKHFRKEPESFEGTKPYRYIPVGRSINFPKQGVYLYHMIEEVIKNAKKCAVAHCTCRVSQNLLGKGCEHPTEVCLKFNELAQYTIDKGFAREISKEEALEIIKLSEEHGLVHFVDNAQGDIQHNCNCCGCVCWNVSPIRNRKIPRDKIMDTYFLRVTDENECIGCGSCIDICPVNAVEMIDEKPVADMNWCIGCGVCATKCPSNAIKMVFRDDKNISLPAENFKKLHDIILNERYC